MAQISISSWPLTTNNKLRLSIILPVLNEADRLPKTLQSLSVLRQSGAETIVVDGGSCDATVLLATDSVDCVLSVAKGRAFQMNSGARVARGDFLLFLHADTVMPNDAQVELLEAVHNQSMWGRFDVRLTGRNAMFRIVEFCMNLRSRLTGIATGDQAIFVDRNVFAQVGGYPEVPLMEDVVLSTKLRRLRMPLCIKTKVIADSRRWESNGILRTIILMWILRFLFFVGIDANRLARFYYG